GLVDQACLDTQVDDLALAGNACTVHDVELYLLERRGDLVLDDLDAGLVADDLVALLDRTDAADVEAYRGIELECVAARGGLGVAEHDPDLHADLVDEDHHAVGTLDRGGELAQRLAHQAGLQAGQGIAHVAFDFGLGHQRGDRVDDDQVDRPRTHQGIGDFQGLLAGIGLRDQQVFEIDAQARGVLDVQCVLGIDEGAGAADLLHFGDDLQGERGLAGGFGAIDFDHASARQPPDTQGDVQPQGTGGHDLDVVFDLVVAVAHDGALAELLFDLRQRGGQRLGAFGVGLAGAFIHEGIPILSDKPQEPRPGGGPGPPAAGFGKLWH